MSTQTETFPPLPWTEWKDTCTTLHLWTQIVGKIRLALSPMMNHWWQVPLYVTARGLSTSPIPFKNRSFQIDFDFFEHELIILCASGSVRKIALQPRTVADFYEAVMSALKELHYDVKILTQPSEIVDGIPFEKDTVHASYDAEYAHRFWRVLVQADRQLREFRADFLGKSSPVHFFWGSFDLAVTRFSGRRAPEHPGGVPHLADWAVREAYSHEVSSAGFWPGSEMFPEAAYYAYAYPEPDGFKDFKIEPLEVYYHPDMREFILTYDAVRNSQNPDESVAKFLKTTYGAAADLGKWDRAALERK